MANKYWRDIYKRIVKEERGNDMEQNRYNITIEREKDRTLKFSLTQQDDIAYYTCPALRYEPEEALLIDHIATAVGETLGGCNTVFKQTTGKFIVKYKGADGRINAFCADGWSCAEVAEQYKQYNIIAVEKVDEMQQESEVKEDSDSECYWEFVHNWFGPRHVSSGEVTVVKARTEKEAYQKFQKKNVGQNVVITDVKKYVVDSGYKSVDR